MNSVISKITSSSAPTSEEKKPEEKTVASSATDLLTSAKTKVTDAAADVSSAATLQHDKANETVGTYVDKAQTLFQGSKTTPTPTSAPSSEEKKPEEKTIASSTTDLLTSAKTKVTDAAADVSSAATLQHGKGNEIVGTYVDKAQNLFQGSKTTDPTPTPTSAPSSEEKKPEEKTIASSTTDLLTSAKTKVNGAAADVSSAAAIQYGKANETVTTYVDKAQTLFQGSKTTPTDHETVKTKVEE